MDVISEAKNEVNLDEKVTIRNIAGWPVGFSRISEGNGDVTIQAEGTTRISRNEIIAQVQGGNKLFTGYDGYGSHATLFIDDSYTREYLDFDSEDGTRKQNILTDSKVKSIFDTKNFDAFEKKFTSEIVTRAEKFAVMQAIKRLKINDYSRIRFAEKYTGYSLV